MKINDMKELLDQAIILAKKTEISDIAEYLCASNVVHFPVGIGDTVFFLSVKTQFGSLLTSGTVIERKVDALQYDGKIKIISYRSAPNDPCGNLYAYWGELVFGSEDEAWRQLNKLRQQSNIS